MPRRKKNKPWIAWRIWLCLSWMMLWGGPSVASGERVILHLQNGDRLTVEVLNESTNQVTVLHEKFGKITIAAGEISKRERATQPALPTGVSGVPAEQTEPAVAPVPAGPFNTPQKPTAVADPGTNDVPKTASAPVAGTPKAAKPAEEKTTKPKLWNTELQFGLNLRYSQKDQQEYLVLGKATYNKAPFRHIFDYNFNYGRTEDTVTGDRMSGSQKSEFDLTKHLYLFNLLGAGYDEIRRIDLQYEANPGLGVTLINSTNWNFVLKNEIGFGFQRQHRQNGTEQTIYSARLAEIFSWKIPHTKVVADGKAELFPDVENFGQYRLRLEGTLRYPLSPKLSFNLVVLDIYETEPLKGVKRNDLQIRSTLGLRF